MSEQTNTNFSIEKATEFLQSFVGLMKEGCVSKEVYDNRRAACERCEFNQKRSSDNAHFCGSCGCGARDIARLYVEGIPIEEDHSVRLWMPNTNCPKDFHPIEKGTGDFKPVGGRLKQLKNLTMATLGEAVGSIGVDDQLEYINKTAEIVESVVVDDAEMEELEASLEEVLLKDKPPEGYNEQEGANNEANNELSNKDSGFRGDANS